MFAVFLDRPYYPELIGTYPSEVDAVRAAGAAKAENAAEDGEHDATVYVCKIVGTDKFKTHH